MEFDDESDADLLVYMRMEDPQAMDAWGAFYRRHAPEVYRRLGHRFREQLDDDGVSDLHTLTFQRAFANAERFKAKSTDRPTQEREVVAWLCTIAKNLFLNLRREQAKLPTVPIPDGLPEPGESAAVASRRVLAAREVLENGLNDMERAVLLETADWIDLVTRKSNMSRGVAKALADQLGTTVPNIRQVRRRALAKFEKLVSPIIEQVEQRNTQ